MAATIKVDVVSAESSIFTGDAVLVTLPGKSGELGVMSGHLPLITPVNPGFVRIHTTDGKEEQIFIAGGILEVQPNIVTVLADTAIRSEELDEEKAKAALEAVKTARETATGELQIAKLEAEMAALLAELQAIEKIRQRHR